MKILCLFNSIICWSFLSLKRYLFNNLQAFYRNLCSWALFYISPKSVFYSYPNPLYLTFKFECNLYLKLTCYIYFLYPFKYSIATGKFSKTIYLRWQKKSIQISSPAATSFTLLEFYLLFSNSFSCVYKLLWS